MPRRKINHGLVKKENRLFGFLFKPKAQPNIHPGLIPTGDRQTQSRITSLGRKISPYSIMPNFLSSLYFLPKVGLSTSEKEVNHEKFS
jgi:hypothetical protein